MLACARVDRQHEQEQSRAPRAVGRRRGCARCLHADADGWVYAVTSFVSVFLRARAKVALWHFSDMPERPDDVRSWGQNGQSRNKATMSESDPERTFPQGRRDQ